MRKLSAVFGLGCALVVGLALPQPALSDAGGGGGGGGMESPAQQYDPLPDYQNGVSAYQLGDFKAAIKALRRVTIGVPKFVPAQYLLGSAYLKSGDVKSAKRPLEQSVRLDPSMIEAHRDLAIVLLQLGDAAKAADQRAALVAMKDKCAGTCDDKARLEEALTAIDGAMAGKPQALAPLPLGPAAHAEGAYVEAVSLINEHQYGAAIDQLDRAIWLVGPDPDLLTYLGFANRKLRNYAVARGWYEQALAINPAHRGALEYYGELKLELGDVSGARQHLARLDALCTFGCQQADELRRWLREDARSAS